MNPKERSDLNKQKQPINAAVDTVRVQFCGRHKIRKAALFNCVQFGQVKPLCHFCFFGVMRMQELDLNATALLEEAGVKWLAAMSAKENCNVVVFFYNTNLIP